MDAKLREAERKWLGDLENQELLVSYWRLCLLSGSIPKPNWTFPDGGDIHWFLGSNWADSIGDIVDYDDRRVAYRKEKNGLARVRQPGVSSQYEDISEREAQTQIKIGIQKLVGKYDAGELEL